MSEYKVNESAIFPDFLPAKITDEERKIVDKALRIMSRKYPLGPQFSFPDVAIAYFQLHLGALEREHFVMVCLNSGHHLLKCYDLHQGTIDGSEVHPREVVKAALNANAAAVLFAHNHPSGSVQPSFADKELTSVLKNALALVGVRVLDHIIVANGESYSFARAGEL